MQQKRDRIYSIPARACSAIGLGSLAISGGGAVLAQIPNFYPTAEGSHDFAAADFDRDGSVDLAISSSGGAMTILFNDGDGLFSRRVELGAGGGAYIVAGDIDRDYDADLIAADGTTIHVLLNDGTGQFGAPIVFASGHAVNGIALGDVTGDGAPDLVLSEGGGGTLWFEALLNDGAGGFVSGAERSFFSDRPATFSAVAGDFDGDGDVDAVILSQGEGGYHYYHSAQLCVLLNAGDGRQWTDRTQRFAQGDFAGPPSHLVAADFDRDGDLDLMYNDGVEEGSADQKIMRNAGDAVFRLLGVWTPSFDMPARGGRLADYDGNGSVDAITVVSNSGSSAVYMLNGPTLMGDPNHGGATKVDTPELSGDGLRDLVTLVSSPQAGVLVLLNETVTDRPVLAQTQLVRGQQAMFEVSLAEEGERVFFLYSLLGVDTSVGIHSLGGLSIDLVSPVVAGSAIANELGTARLLRMVRSSAPAEAILATQSVVKRGLSGRNSVKTNFVTAPINR